MNTFAAQTTGAVQEAWHDKQTMSSLADHDRFLALMEEHKKILYKVAYAYCRDPEDRNDLIQEVVIQLWLSFKKFDGRCRFSTWMYRIAMNVAISFYRSQRRRIRDAVPIDGIDGIDGLGLEIVLVDPLLEETGDELRQLHQFIGQMDALNRALIILYLDGYSHDEIAEIVGITPTNVATRINRIKQKLQRDFDTAQTN